MRRLSKIEFDAEMDMIKRENVFRERERQLREAREAGKTPRKLPSTSKLVLICAMALCVEIVLFAEFAMVALNDASSVYALIGIPAALAPIIWGYYSKAKAENVAGGITYESAMRELDEQSVEDNPEGGGEEC